MLAASMCAAIFILNVLAMVALFIARDAERQW